MYINYPYYPNFLNVALLTWIYITNDFGYSGKSGSKQKIYGLNISGAFGSRNIRFYSKQKRDEARNILRNFSKTRIEADIAFN